LILREVFGVYICNFLRLGGFSYLYFFSFDQLSSAGSPNSPNSASFSSWLTWVSVSVFSLRAAQTRLRPSSLA